MKLVSQWVKDDIFRMDAEAKEKGWGHMLYETFHREKHNVVHHNDDIFYSPCCGTVIYQKIVKDTDEKMLDIKGQTYSLKDLIQYPDYLDESEDGYLVIGVFLTLYDVHTIKMPTRGHIKNDFLSSIKTNNLPMTELEFDIIKHQKLDFDHLDYAYENERMISTVYHPTYKMNYHMVSLSDRVVNTILPYYDECILMQGQTFGKIMYGSQMDIIIPLNNSWYDYELMVPEGELYHVESGTDPLVRLWPYNDEE